MRSDLQTTGAPESYNYGRRRGKHKSQYNRESAMRGHRTGLKLDTECVYTNKMGCWQEKGTTEATLMMMCKGAAATDYQTSNGNIHNANRTQDSGAL